MQTDRPDGPPIKIKVRKNGPYIVLGKVPLSKMSIEESDGDFLLAWKKNEELPQEDEVWLCRCGQSKSKPFCDGTHNSFDFNGEETFDNTPFLDLANLYEGADLDLLDAYDLCASAHFCMRAGTTWDLIKDTDLTSKEYAAKEVADCPSGRLVLIDKTTGKEIEPISTPSISFIQDKIEGVHGPIHIRGRIPIESADGTTYELRNRVTLCRCGQSSNKPFCDSTHISNNFQA